MPMRLYIFVSKCFAVVGINVLGTFFFSIFHNVKTLSDAHLVSYVLGSVVLTG
jgi:hypothetical protein